MYKLALIAALSLALIGQAEAASGKHIMHKVNGALERRCDELHNREAANIYLDDDDDLDHICGSAYRAERPNDPG